MEQRSQPTLLEGRKSLLGNKFFSHYFHFFLCSFSQNLPNLHKTLNALPPPLTFKGKEIPLLPKTLWVRPPLMSKRYLWSRLVRALGDVTIELWAITSLEKWWNSLERDFKFDHTKKAPTSLSKLCSRRRPPFYPIDGGDREKRRWKESQKKENKKFEEEGKERIEYEKKAKRIRTTTEWESRKKTEREKT